MIKHNICAKFGANMIALKQSVKHFHKKHAKFIYNLEPWVVMEALLLVVIALISLNHDYWATFWAAHIVFYTALFGTGAFLWFIMSSPMKRFYKFIDKTIQRFKVNSRDEYLQRKLNK